MLWNSPMTEGDSYIRSNEVGDELLREEYNILYSDVDDEHSHSYEDDECDDYDLPNNEIEPPPLPDKIIVVRNSCGDLSIAMSVEGMTCIYCMRMIETVLNGFKNNVSPIKGLLDSVADLESNSVLIRIDNIENVKTIATAAARSMAAVGYVGTVKGVENGSTVSKPSAAGSAVVELEGDVFDWRIQCSCKDDIVDRKCVRRMQMRKNIQAFFEISDNSNDEQMVLEE